MKRKQMMALTLAVMMGTLTACSSGEKEPGNCTGKDRTAVGDPKRQEKRGHRREKMDGRRLLALQTRQWMSEL